MKKQLQKLLVVFLLLMFVAPISGSLFGADKNGFYLSLNGAYLYLTGSDFNGDTIYYSSDELLIVPEIEPNISYGGSLGMKSNKIAYEFRYERASLSGPFLGVTYNSVFNTVSIFVKRYLSTRSSLKPHFDLGVGYSWLVIKKGSETLDTPPQVGNATYTGLNLDIGFGFSYFVFPRMSIDFGLLGRFLFFSSGKGVTDYRYDLDESLFGYGILGMIGLTYVF